MKLTLTAIGSQEARFMEPPMVNFAHRSIVEDLISLYLLVLDRDLPAIDTFPRKPCTFIHAHQVTMTTERKTCEACLPLASQTERQTDEDVEKDVDKLNYSFPQNYGRAGNIICQIWNRGESSESGLG